MSAPKAPQMNMVPTIDAAALPDTPAHEWAEGTSSALQSKLDDQSPQPIHSLNTDATMSSSPIGVGGARVSAPPLTSKASTSSTPGNEFPGAYPRDNSTTPGMATSAASTAKDTAYQIYESAKQYIPAQEDIQQTLENASTTAKQYLPASVGAYLPDGKQAISLPSQEVYGNMGTSSDGVGALPGTLSEVSVAKLPEERRLEGLENAKSFGSSYAREQAWSQTSSGGVGDLPGPKSETGVAILPDERITRGMSGGTGGSSPKTDSDVIRSPEEKTVNGGFKGLTSKPVVTTTNQHSTTSPVNHLSAGSNAQADSNASNVALPPTPGSGGYSTNNAVLPPAIPSTGNEFGGASAGGVVNSGGFGTPAQNAVATTDAHDAATLDAAKAAGVEPKDTDAPAVPPKTSGVPRRVADDKPIARKGELIARQHILEETEKMNDVIRKDISEVATTGHGSHHGRTASQTESRRKSHDFAASHLDTRAASDHPKDRSGSMSSSSSKPSFMDKVKGEVKVISGKLGKNEEKVEEGRRMMGKE
ncbi:hypothetical protein PC9H_011723 [Pleurotus ostreatus]|uniref:Uncharacterized protein n=1 Tax=Pleurotus ostreatus TaxID=5322 RepID=A0A8H6ZLL3_PLEOS|nr:uncharacterized protein PC9H_011723 [Pleurotus ostreatus]KAF7421203.1 hypothetical protein PC9H_011723 [Pleurotus ostreatus]KAJ8690754.1 hypothetical protein PTI98_012157 [Pleurotus ostreatus]